MVSEISKLASLKPSAEVLFTSETMNGCSKFELINIPGFGSIEGIGVGEDVGGGVGVSVGHRLGRLLGL